MCFEDALGLVKRAQPGEPILFRRVSDLDMSLAVLDGKPATLIQMPRPERPPEAFFACVVLLAEARRPDLWPRDVQVRIFTLELELDSHGSSGLICEWLKDGAHHNFGLSVLAQKPPFLQAVETLLRGSQTSAS
jgi:hypothetical protein